MQFKGKVILLYAMLPVWLLPSLCSLREKKSFWRMQKILGKSKKFGISEQLPMELQNHKQKLISKFREARAKKQDG